MPDRSLLVTISMVKAGRAAHAHEGTDPANDGLSPGAFPAHLTCFGRQVFDDSPSPR
ncbi:exported hypothetical protein [Hyphomicrobium sp. GJ21]|nr:exported hypothetical protein [Hyphomicrobium sp. GJ21]